MQQGHGGEGNGTYNDAVHVTSWGRRVGPQLRIPFPMAKQPAFAINVDDKGRAAYFAGPRMRGTSSDAAAAASLARWVTADRRRDSNGAIVSKPGCRRIFLKFPFTHRLASAVMEGTLLGDHFSLSLKKEKRNRGSQKCFRASNHTRPYFLKRTEK